MVTLLVGLAACDARTGQAAQPVTRSEADALAAAEKGQFGFISAASDGNIGPVNVVCRAPLWRRGTDLLNAGRFYISDVVGDDDPKVLQANYAYAASYNATILAHPSFPHPDVCRLAGPGEQSSSIQELALWEGSEPVLKIDGPTRNLHDAARRGSLAELEQWLMATMDVDRPDDFGLSALAWAVLRNRADHVQVLLQAGANPLPDRPLQEEQAPLWLAARLDRPDLFNTLADRIDPVPEWSVGMILAATSAGSAEILDCMLKGRHEPVSHEWLSSQAGGPGAEATRRVLDAWQADLCWNVPIPANAQVHVVSAYESADNGLITVRVGEQDRPVVLALSASRRVTWMIEAAPGARIVGILGRGYEQPSVMNAPSGVPVVLNDITRRCTRESVGPYPSRPGSELDELSKRVAHTIRRPVASAQAIYAADVFVIGRNRR